MSMRTKFFASMRFYAVRGGGSHETIAARINTFRIFSRVMKEENYQIYDASQIRLKHLKVYVALRMAQGVKARTLQKELSHLRTLLRMVGKQKFADDPAFNNAFFGVAGASRKGTGRPCTDEEFAAVQAKAEALNAPGLGAIARLQRCFGLRMMEALRAHFPTLREWLEAIQAGDPIRVILGTKGGRERFTHVVDEAAARDALLKAMSIAEANGRYLISPANGLKGAVNKYKNFMQQTRCRSHSFRYRFAQDLYRKYRFSGHSINDACILVGIDLGHGDGRGRYVKMVYCLGMVDPFVPHKPRQSRTRSDLINGTGPTNLIEATAPTLATEPITLAQITASNSTLTATSATPATLDCKELNHDD